MIISMPTIDRSQQRYHHRLRNLVQRTGDVTVATDLGVPRRQHACVLGDQSCCPRMSPSRLTPSEVRAIKDLVTSPEYRHVPTGTLAVLA
jgi:hypothetical protein